MTFVKISEMKVLKTQPGQSSNARLLEDFGHLMWLLPYGVKTLHGRPSL